MKIFEKSYDWRNTLSKRGKTEYIIVHNADAVSCTADDIHRWHLNNGWSGIGYHFFIRKNGNIYRGRPIDSQGSHALNYNSASVGICFEGKYHSSDLEMPTEQFNAGRELLFYLQNIYPNAKVVAHRDLNSTSCPGQHFPFDKLKSLEVIDMIENKDLALQKLVRKGVINSPDYWMKACDVVLYLDKLIINFANKL